MPKYAQCLLISNIHFLQWNCVAWLFWGRRSTPRRSREVQLPPTGRKELPQTQGWADWRSILRIGGAEPWRIDNIRVDKNTVLDTNLFLDFELWKNIKKSIIDRWTTLVTWGSPISAVSKPIGSSMTCWLMEIPMIVPNSEVAPLEVATL